MTNSTVWRSLILERALLPAADWLSGQQVMSFYCFFRECQWWPLERLIDEQRKRLRQTIQTAYSEVPFYRELLDRHGVKPGAISSRESLARIPAVTKDELRNAYPDRCVRRTSSRVTELFTSGSSGRPFAVKIDSSTLSQARALMLLRATFSGWTFGDPHLQTGMSLSRGAVKWFKDLLLRVQYVSAYDLTDATLDRYLSIIEDKRLEFLMGYPGSIYLLARRAREVRFSLGLRGIVCWGDNLFPHYRQEIENAFRCAVTDTYGCGEGIQVAAQCREGAYHVFMPHVMVETVDEQGSPVPMGSPGNVLLTRLDAGAMPLIRYRVGDVARIAEPATCACGRGLESFASIEGRETDIVVTPRGNRLIVHFFTGIFEYFPSVDTFKITQEQPDAILVQIVPRPDFEPSHWTEIKKQILEKGDPDLRIDMSIVREIPLESSNKRRFVVSTIGAA